MAGAVGGTTPQSSAVAVNTPGVVAPARGLAHPIAHAQTGVVLAGARLPHHGVYPGLKGVHATDGGTQVAFIELDARHQIEGAEDTDDRPAIAHPSKPWPPRVAVAQARRARIEKIVDGAHAIDGQIGPMFDPTTRIGTRNRQPISDMGHRLTNQWAEIFPVDGIRRHALDCPLDSGQRDVVEQHRRIR
jgi:hypothetical protein